MGKSVDKALNMGLPKGSKWNYAAGRGDGGRKELGIRILDPRSSMTFTIHTHICMYKVFIYLYLQ